MNKKLLVWILAAMIATPSAAFAGTLRRQPANLGTAREGSQVGMFSYSFDNGSVAAVVPPMVVTADWAMGLVIDSVPPSMKVTLLAKARSPGASVRIVMSASGGNQISATPFQALPVGTEFHSLDFFPIADSTFVFVDAIMNDGASILGAEFNQ